MRTLAAGGGEPHCDEARRDVGEVQVEAMLAEALLLAADDAWGAMRGASGVWARRCFGVRGAARRSRVEGCAHAGRRPGALRAPQPRPPQPEVPRPACTNIRCPAGPAAHSRRTNVAISSPWARYHRVQLPDGPAAGADQRPILIPRSWWPGSGQGRRGQPGSRSCGSLAPPRRPGNGESRNGVFMKRPGESACKAGGRQQRRRHSPSAGGDCAPLRPPRCCRAARSGKPPPPGARL